MLRRTFLSILALAAVAPFMEACGSESKSSTTTAGVRRSSLRGNAAHLTSGNDPKPAAKAINAFAHNLFDRLVAADPSANLVFSPASIAVALTMTSAGAKGTTLQEMLSVLQIADPTSIHQSMNGLTNALAALNQSLDNTTQGGSGTSEVELSIANSLWGQAGLAFEQAFLDLLSADYDAGLELVDYKADPEAARVAINNWVKQQTKDRIPQLLAQGTITTDSRLTLVNAIYLKANWATKFSKDLTKDGSFAAPAGKVTVPMMHRQDRLDYASGDGWQAVDLPYAFAGLSFVVAVGDTPEVVLPTGDEVFGALQNRLVQLTFPKFDIETATDLTKVLEAMGMTTAFSVNADFSGMTTAEQLDISAVVHQANITVDEEGTEAAAATAVVMEATSLPAPEEPVVVTLDRPFTYWL
ncbi:MAG: serpin family protein, partial [Ilumatobacteraceae bacterium]